MRATLLNAGRLPILLSLALVDGLAAAGMELAVIPHVGARDDFEWRKRNHGAYEPADRYADIVLLQNSTGGVVIGVGAFGLVWHIWWLVGMHGLHVTTGIVWSFAMLWPRP